MREGELSGEHIWLRQSVTYTHEGQTRTLEIALPIRPDAPAEEVARLLAQAEAGMAQLTTSLDRRIAGEQIAPPRPVAAPTTEWTEPAQEIEKPVSPGVDEPSPPPVSERVAETQAAPAAQSSPRQPAPAPRPAPIAPPASPAATGPDLTRPEFIAEISALGLNPKEAMDRLGVRSLAGLNLREALETLRRQALQGGGSSSVAPTASHAPAEARGDALSVKPDRFDEEDDDALIFVEEGEDLDGDESPPSPRQAQGTRRFAADALDNSTEDDLDDVPDFGPPASPHSRASAPAEPPMPRAAQIIARLRAAHPGGIATADRQSALANIIVAELGEPTATALVRGLWKLSPDKLGPEQLDALIRWGKDDTFSEEAEEVLATLRAEQRARTSGSQSTSARSQAQGASSRKRGES